MIECVPNFSEGRDLEKVAQIRAAIETTRDILLLGCESDADHNRTVITFAGPPNAVGAAALQAAVTASKIIDLTTHWGVHPRIGAADVIPFVPLQGSTMDECVALAKSTAASLWEVAGVPSYLYEFAALRPDRRQLESFRKLGFEKLGNLQPDIGGPALHPTAGACAIGARRILIACNVNLATRDRSIANRIARAIRTSSGGFPHVKALAFELASRGLVQVSLNLTHYEETPLDTVYNAIESQAHQQGVEIAETELIGFVPRAAAERAPGFIAKCREFSPSRILENRIAEVIACQTAEH